MTDTISEALLATAIDRSLNGEPLDLLVLCDGDEDRAAALRVALEKSLRLLPASAVTWAGPDTRIVPT